MSEKQTYVTTGDVAEHFDVSTRTIRNWLAKGLFPGAVKMSPLSKSDWLIPESAIESFEEKRQAASKGSQ